MKVIKDNNRDLKDFKRAIKNLDQYDSKRASSRKYQQQDNSSGNINTSSVLGISSFGGLDSSAIEDYPLNRHREQVIKNFYRIPPGKKPKSVGRNQTRLRKAKSKPNVPRQHIKNGSVK